MSRPRTGFARWWRGFSRRPHPLVFSTFKDTAHAGWAACKEAARQAVFDTVGDDPMTSHLRAALDRIDSL